MTMDANDEEQQYCLRWNNFQTNITTQFEALRDDEDFTDVTIACDGQRIQAHKVVLSACSPLFKELFKSNPCPHPIIFMRDVDAGSIIALMEFMYTGEVNVAQAHLTSFLKTAESLKIRGLTDPNSDILQHPREKESNKVNPSLSNEEAKATILQTKCISLSQCNNSAVTSSQDINQTETCLNLDVATGTINKERNLHHQRTQEDNTDDDVKRVKLKQFDDGIDEAIDDNIEITDTDIRTVREPKVELPEYLSDDERGDVLNDPILDIAAGMEILPLQAALSTHFEANEHNYVSTRSTRTRTRNTFKNLSSPFEMHMRDSSPDLFTQLADGDNQTNSNRLVKLAEGIEIYEEQLRGVKWNDYRKLTRGLATILFSPSELATCSVTGQRWSRAGNDERPVKPALDRAKVQAIISYVASRFPMVEISRIKQVLAYKCKENSTAFKMKAVRYFAGRIRESDKK